MPVKVTKQLDGIGREHWLFRCPGCDDLHVLMGWKFNGDVEKPTFEPSVLVRMFEPDGTTEKSRCHSYVREGKIEYLTDCTHALAGKTIDLPDW